MKTYMSLPPEGAGVAEHCPSTVLMVLPLVNVLMSLLHQHQRLNNRLLCFTYIYPGEKHCVDLLLNYYPTFLGGIIELHKKHVLFICHCVTETSHVLLLV